MCSKRRPPVSVSLRLAFHWSLMKNEYLVILHVLHRLGVVLLESRNAARDEVGQVVTGVDGRAPRIEIRGALGPVTSDCR
jgi:hypothetical protein